VPLTGDVVALLQAGRSTHPRALRVGFWWSAAARERCGARLGVPVARRGGFRVGAASAGAGRGKRTSVRVCTGSYGARTAAPALGTLAPGGDGLGAADAGSWRPGKTFAGRNMAWVLAS